MYNLDSTFRSTYSTAGWLGERETLYRLVTEDAAASIAQNDYDALRQRLEHVPDPPMLANALYFRQTGYLYCTPKEMRSGDRPGPLFESHGPMVEEIAFSTHGIRLLGWALMHRSDRCVELLVESGARIPGGLDFPEGAIRPGKKAGFDVERTEGLVTVVNTGVGGGPLAIIQNEYRAALGNYVSRQQDQDRRRALDTLTKLGLPVDQFDPKHA